MGTHLILRRITLAALVILASGMAWPSFAEGARKVQPPQQFFESLNDIPLMPGLYEIVEESVVFDKPGGRIAESQAASTELASEEIRSFYEKTLPQMGWERIAPQSFVRQDEALTMEVRDANGYRVVRFMVSPR